MKLKKRIIEYGSIVLLIGITITGFSCSSSQYEVYEDQKPSWFLEDGRVFAAKDVSVRKKGNPWNPFTESLREVPQTNNGPFGHLSHIPNTPATREYATIESQQTGCRQLSQLLDAAEYVAYYVGHDDAVWIISIHPFIIATSEHIGNGTRVDTSETPVSGFHHQRRINQVLDEDLARKVKSVIVCPASYVIPPKGYSARVPMRVRQFKLNSAVPFARLYELAASSDPENSVKSQSVSETEYELRPDM